MIPGGAMTHMEPERDVQMTVSSLYLMPSELRILLQQPMWNEILNQLFSSSYWGSLRDDKDKSSEI